MSFNDKTIIELAEILDGAMCFTSTDGEDYFTTPISNGAIEIESDGKVYYREWALDHGMRHEEVIGEVPDVPVYEMASWIRMMLVNQEFNRDLNCGADEPLIYRACKLAQLNNEEISHGTARTIAAAYDDYRYGIHSFVSTGEITDDDLWWNLFGTHYKHMSADLQLSADMLGTYLVKRRMGYETGPVDNWSRMWVDKP